MVLKNENVLPMMYFFHLEGLWSFFFYLWQPLKLSVEKKKKVEQDLKNLCIMRVLNQDLLK